ncbi:hypothetical protein Y1Q_0009578 [Alligator mississippiensis]|uniref:Uncharacterized protein n=1 Tax=Alligator mississippiensis TaxID=8496 RepID=A0A151NVU9_ALLMI|nr:hypothetical protein Y1Q_0009578 [Alligator mississippiensis]
MLHSLRKMALQLFKVECHWHKKAVPPSNGNAFLIMVFHDITPSPSSCEPSHPFKAESHGGGVAAPFHMSQGVRRAPVIPFSDRHSEL